MKPPTKKLLIACGCLGLSLGMQAHTQAQNRDGAAIENAPADSSEPTLDELLGLDDGGDQPQEPEPDADPDAHDHPEDPELSRDLDRRLTGQEAADQFAQAIQEMEEVAIRLGDESDPGIDTQRMQDEIILKLEQIISSAQKTPSQQQSQQQGQQQQPSEARQADQGGQQQPGQQQGQQPGQQQGQQPGEQQGQQPGQQQGQQPGQGQQQGEGEGQQEGEGQDSQQQGQQPGNQSGQGGSQGSIRNEELSMKDLREGEWGNLPPRLRDELAESLSETFNPVYRAATEAFYRRIAELSQQQAEEGGE